MHNHIRQYTTQKRESQHPYTYHVDTLPLRTYGTVPKYPDPVPKQTVLAGAGIRRIPISPDPALLPSPPLLGVSRVTAVQIHPTISRSVRAGSTRQTVPRNRPPRCGFIQQSKCERSATWWPGDIHTRPSVQFAERQMEREERRLEREKEREEQQKQREEQQRQRDELEKQREDNERQREHEKEIERMRQESNRESQASRNTESRATAKRPKIPTFDDGKDNIDNYLNRFERLAEVNQWPRVEWAANLSALLTGRALDAYSRLSRHESEDYDLLKTALLTRYGLTGEGYRKKLRGTGPEPNETAGQFINRLTGYITRWINLTDTRHSFEALRDLMIREHFWECCPRALQVYVKEKDVDDLDEIASYVTTYTEAHGRSFQSMQNSVSRFRTKSARTAGDSLRLSHCTASRPTGAATEMWLLRVPACDRRMQKSQELDGGGEAGTSEAHRRLLLVL